MTHSLRVGASSAARREVLLVISAQPHETLRAEIAAGREPRRDYLTLQAALDADLLFPADAAATRVGHLLTRLPGKQCALAWAAFRRRKAYRVIYTDSEGVGLPLALLLKLSGTQAGRPRHVMLTHLLSPLKKRLWFRLGVASHLQTLIVHSSAQRDLAIKTLRVAAERVLLLPYFADERFWRAEAAAGAGEGGPGNAMICAAGLEFRDYTTLLEAVCGLPVEARIAAASSWSHHTAFAGAAELPPNVRVERHGYCSLRALYASANFVVVPLREVNNQAGITTLLEAMAMGKAVIVTRTTGQTDVVRDIFAEASEATEERDATPGFLGTPELAGPLGHLPTGIYVPPGDVPALRRAILYLLEHPEVAAELGRNGRRVVEACFGLDAFTRRFAAVIQGDAALLSAARPSAAVVG